MISDAAVIGDSVFAEGGAPAADARTFFFGVEADTAGIEELGSGLDELGSGDVAGIAPVLLPVCDTADAGELGDGGIGAVLDTDTGAWGEDGGGVTGAAGGAAKSGGAAEDPFFAGGIRFFGGPAEPAAGFALEVGVGIAVLDDAGGDLAVLVFEGEADEPADAGEADDHDRIAGLDEAVLLELEVFEDEGVTGVAVDAVADAIG